MKTIRIQKESTESMDQFELRVSIMNKILSNYNTIGPEALQTLSSSIANKMLLGQEYDGYMGEVITKLKNIL